MLVLTRKVGESLYLNAAEVTINKSNSTRVSLGIKAPESVIIGRDPIDCDPDELASVEASLDEALAVADETHQPGLNVAMLIIQEQLRKRRTRRVKRTE